MNLLPIQYLHLETFIMPVFLAMVLLVQLARSSEPDYYVQSGQSQLLWLVAAFILFTGVFAAFLFRVSPLLAIELAAGCTLSLMHPVNALCFFLHMLYLRPWEIVASNPLLLALPRALAVLCFLSWLLHLRQHGSPTRQTHKALLILLAFSGWSLLSTLAAPHATEALADWFQTYFKSLIVFVMCLYFIDSERSVSEFELTLMISTLVLMGVGFYQFLVEGTASGRLELFGLFGNSNDLAALVVIAVPFALVRIFHLPVGLLRQVLGISFAAFCLLVIWYTKSRGAMMALGLQFLIYRSLHGSRIQWFRTGLLLGVLSVGYVAALKVLPRNLEDMQVSEESRITYWKAAASMTLHHPLLGVGFDQYPNNYDSYASGNVYEWGSRTAHSSWLLAFAESGLPGGILYITFFLAVLFTAWRNRESWPDQLIALVGYGVVMTFLSHTYLLYLFLLAGLILASNSLQERVGYGI